MARYRHELPHLQPDAPVFLGDGGMETTLIFLDGVDLPHFAAFVLLDSPEGRGRLRRYYEPFLRLARDHGLGFILDTPTWRANADWGRLLGYDAEALRGVNLASVAMADDLRAAWEPPSSPIVINGAIGPRGDGYKTGDMRPDEAERYHRPQVAAFAEGGADMVTGYTLTSIGEAIGIARAAAGEAMPCAISFTVETDGKLPDGRTLREAVEAVDESTGAAPLYFMVNCAHPDHFEPALAPGEAWTSRIRGVRANASRLSHAELDEATTLDAGDPDELGLRYRQLSSAFPTLRVLGGCCGTDHRHLAAICEVCWPVTAPETRSRVGGGPGRMRSSRLASALS